MGAHDGIITEMGGEALARNDPRRPACLSQLNDTVGLLTAPSSTEPHLVVHLPPTFPWGAPDVFLPGDRISGIRPHINHEGLICSRGHRVFANPNRPKEVIERVVNEAASIVDQQFSNEERAEHFLQEAQAYWLNKEPQPRFLFIPKLIDENFVFECVKAQVGPIPIYTARELTEAPEIIGFRFELPTTEIEAFLNDPEEWWTTNEAAKLRLIEGLSAINKLTHRPKKAEAVLCFRTITQQGAFILAAHSTNPISLKKLLGRHQTHWASRFQEQALQFGSKLERLTSDNLGTSRLVRRALGNTQTSTTAFTAITNTRLTVVGCGSLGSHIIDLLIQAGIQKMYLVDNDLLMPENSARHTLPGMFWYTSKAKGICQKWQTSFPENELLACLYDIRHPDAQRNIRKFGPSLVISATAELNAEMLLSESCRKGELPGCWFCWVEPELAAGHLVFQPSESTTTLADLYETVGEDWLYRHRVSPDGPPILERECGCHTVFTPFSGVEAALFSALCAREILKHIETPLTTIAAFRWKPDAASLERLS